MILFLSNADTELLALRVAIDSLLDMEILSGSQVRWLDRPIAVVEHNGVLEPGEVYTPTASGERLSPSHSGVVL